MKNAVIYVHGLGGSAETAKRFAPLFPDRDVIGFDYHSQTPWEAEKEFPEFFDGVIRDHGGVCVIADSLGAYFTLLSLYDRHITEAFFISPVTDMEKLIREMMARAGVTESELKEKGELVTASGETLSWDYLCFVKNRRPPWKTPTHIFYGEIDALVAFETVSAFARETGATLDVMPGGEHWFHTEAQLRFLDENILKYTRTEKRNNLRLLLRGRRL